MVVFGLSLLGCVSMDFTDLIVVGVVGEGLFYLFADFLVVIV